MRKSNPVSCGSAWCQVQTELVEIGCRLRVLDSQNYVHMSPHGCWMMLVTSERSEYVPHSLEMLHHIAQHHALLCRELNLYPRHLTLPDRVTQKAIFASQKESTRIQVPSLKPLPNTSASCRSDSLQSAVKRSLANELRSSKF